MDEAFICILIKALVHEYFVKTNVRRIIISAHRIINLFLSTLLILRYTCNRLRFLLSIHFCKVLMKIRDCFNAFIIIKNVVFFIWRMEVVIVQAKTQ